MTNGQGRGRQDDVPPHPEVENARVDANADDYLTTDHGVRVSHTDNSLRAGERGPTLMADFHFREKITHFDHERIPERVVHARGSGAHGYFEVYDNSLAQYTKARFLSDPSLKTPVFVRFSTVVGSRGAADTARDVRGFATKFYTEEGNFDLVGNNMPIFFIQDGIKFPDLVHAVKPEPNNEMPQGASAHDTFWDFASLQPESTHMLMWLLSDRAIPKSFRTMDGFGVHTFRLVNAEGKGTFVKFHWRPVLGTASLVWDESQKLAGKDPDWHRRDLWEAIETGNFPEWEFAVQLIPEEDELKYAFDVLDATKIVPEELVPLQRVGRMVLNRNPDNFFAETEQVAFHTANLVPGIDFTNDPLLQARNFSYLDTQLLRLGGPNFTHIPINAPIARANTNHRDGFHQQRIPIGRASYFPNSLGGGNPKVAPEEEGGYVHYTERVEGQKIRLRSPSFADHFSQAAMFWQAQTDAEKEHLIEAGQFELAMCDSMAVRERVIANFNKVDHTMAVRIAEGIGVTPPTEDESTQSAYSAPEVSVERGAKPTIKTRKVAVLLADGFDAAQFSALKSGVEAEGGMVKVIAKQLGTVSGAGGDAVNVDKSYKTGASIMFDAVYVPGGSHIEALKTHGDALHFVNEAYRHGKPVGATGEGVDLIDAAALDNVQLSTGGAVKVDRGVVTARGDDGFVPAFIEAMKAHRHFAGRMRDAVPA